jgi:nitroimidazol reductase NimA-like FMN-containing flavoprotein (pyridoxamine 5'-phosphate oxidase superfamily)
MTKSKKLMLGQLTTEQCEQILASEVVGRIGCYADHEVNIVPITYVFDKGLVYAHSKEGHKIDMMRKNPKVCFQVDRIENMASWRSVIGWGVFEELKEKLDQETALRVLRERLSPLTTSDSVRTSHSADPNEVRRERHPVLYRISLYKVSGRFEKR